MKDTKPSLENNPDEINKMIQNNKKWEEQYICQKRIKERDFVNASLMNVKMKIEEEAARKRDEIDKENDALQAIKNK